MPPPLWVRFLSPLHPKHPKPAFPHPSQKLLISLLFSDLQRIPQEVQKASLESVARNVITDVIAREASTVPSYMSPRIRKEKNDDAGLDDGVDGEKGRGFRGWT